MSSSARINRRDFLDGTLRLTAGTIAASVGAGCLAKSSEPKWKIGCYTRPWAKYDYRVALDEIAKAGFEYVGLMTTNSKSRLVISASTTPEQAAQVGQEVRKRGLTVLSVYGGGIGVGKSLQKGIEDMRRLIDNCAACGCRSLLMGGTASSELYKAYYKAIAESCDYAAEKGMEIVVKPHGGLNATGPQCRKTVELVAHKNFRIWYDPGNMFYYSDGELDPVVDAPTVEGLVTGMCVKDYLHPKNVALTPGTGKVDFPRVFQRLQAGGFTSGSLVIECLEPGDLQHTLAEARKARAFLERLTGNRPAPAKPEISKTSLKAGLATVDITPPLGYRMSGYFRERLSTGTANPLNARALVLQQGDARVAMVFCDIIGLSRQVSDLARKKASRTTGIPPENILLTATHTHTGPLYCGALRDHFHNLAVAEHGNDPCEKLDYSGELAAKLADAITQAAASASSVRLEAGSARQRGLSFNRRFHMKNGTVRFNPGVLNPDIVKVAGPIDPQVGLLFIRDAATSQRLASITNFALHLDTVGGTEYAADYPYYLQQSLKKAYGRDFVSMFATGTCGDINHIDVTKRERLKTEYIGKTLAETVKTAAGRLANLKEPLLAAKSRTITVPMQKFTPEEIAWATENIEKVGTRELSFLEQVKAYKILDIQARGGDNIDLEVQVIRLSADAAIVALPGEVFVDIGLAIKKASPFENTMVVELVQDAPGYIPTQKAFEEGSYETVNSRIAPGGGEKLLATAVQLLESLA